MNNILKFAVVISFISLVSCKNEGPQKINFGKDQCEFCKMTIADTKYGTELVTEKGRAYKFDDISCMKKYEEQNAEKIGKAKLFVPDFTTSELFPIEQATLISGGELTSPMGGNTATFKDKTQALQQAEKLGASQSNY